MHLLTEAGTFQKHEVASRDRAWPLAGIGTDLYGTMRQQGLEGVDLTSTSTQRRRFQTYAAVYRNNPWVYSCVNTVARLASRLPVDVYEREPDGSALKIDWRDNDAGRLSGPRALDKLLERPNPDTSSMELWYGTIVDLLVFGNALWSIDKDSTGVRRLWRVPWRYVVVHYGSQVPIIGYEVSSAVGSIGLDGFSGGLSRPVETKDGSRFLIPEDVVHFGRGTDPEEPIGSSPLASLQPTLRLYDALMRHLNAFFANSARPSGHLKVQPGTQGEALDNIKETVRQLYTSPENAGKVLVTSGDWQQMSSSPEHSSVIELLDTVRTEICAAFGVPPPLVGILDRAIFSNVKELRGYATRDVVGPLTERLESDLSSQLLPQSRSWEGTFLAFDADEQLRPDLDARISAYQRGRHVWTINEMRRMENLPPIEDDPAANAVWMPMSEKPVGADVPFAEELPPADDPDAPELDPEDVEPTGEPEEPGAQQGPAGGGPAGAAGSPPGTNAE